MVVPVAKIRRWTAGGHVGQSVVDDLHDLRLDGADSGVDTADEQPRTPAMPQPSR
jgi:hypothetical protein